MLMTITCNSHAMNSTTTWIVKNGFDAHMILMLWHDMWFLAKLNLEENI